MLYIPIEKVFPNWPQAREVVKEAIPTRVSFKHDPQFMGTISVNFDWMDRVANAVPDKVTHNGIEEILIFNETLFTDMIILANDIMDSMLACIKNKEESFIGQPINNVLLNSLSTIVDLENRNRIANGLPSFYEGMLHVFGIEPSLFVSKMEKWS